MASREYLDETQGAAENAVDGTEHVEMTGIDDGEPEGNSEIEENERDWKHAHAALIRFAQVRARMDWEEGQLLLWTLRSGAHARLGYATFPEYIERLLGYGPRFVFEKVRVAEALEALPELSQALKDGELTWSAVRELTRVAVPETEHEWRKVAIGRTAREVERFVSGRRPGDRPSDGSDPRVRRHVLRFEVSGETLAVFRDALARIRRATSGPLNDDSSLMLMARHVLDGPRDDGRANYQIQLMVCESCGRGEQLGKGERIPIGPEVVDMCQCDAQLIADPHMGDAHMGDAHMGHEMESRVDTVGSEDVWGTEHADGNGEVTEHPVNEMSNGEMSKGDTGRIQAARAQAARSQAARAQAARAQAARSQAARAQAARAQAARGQVAQTQAVEARARGPRAMQPIPPAIRRAVMLRDGGRCVVPGCRNAVFVDVHHLSPRREGGRNKVDNLCCNCVAHHRAIHDGTLVVEGEPSSGLVFRHADGTPYGGAVSTEKAEVGAQVFQALIRLGFRETDARRAIREGLTQAGLAPAAMSAARRREELLRSSVEFLTPSR